MHLASMKTASDKVKLPPLAARKEELLAQTTTTGMKAA